MRAKARPVALDAADGLPWPLTEGASVRWFAPNLWAKHDGQTPAPDDPDRIAGLMLARRTYHEYFMRWAADQDMDWDDARRHKVNRRPHW